MINFLRERFSDVFNWSSKNMPYERMICNINYLIRCLFASAGVISVTFLLVSMEAIPALGPHLFLYVWLFTGALGAWLSTFIWVDLGGEESFLQILLGYSDNPKVLPVGKLEGYCGYQSRSRILHYEWQATKFQPYTMGPPNLNRWSGDPGWGTFYLPDVPGEADRWTIRLHVWLRDRGWVPDPQQDVADAENWLAFHRE